MSITTGDELGKSDVFVKLAVMLSPLIEEAVRQGTGTALSRPAVPAVCLRALGRGCSNSPAGFPSENSTQLNFLRRLLP